MNPGAQGEGLVPQPVRPFHIIMLKMLGGLDYSAYICKKFRIKFK